jgi:hypothetical protein
MLTVSADPVVVESSLAAGELACPCSGVLAPWGWARERTVVGWDRFVRVRPRRARCRACGSTHVLLPTVLLLRRGWDVDVIGGVLELFAVGVAARRIAVQVGIARSTVRGWLARFAQRSGRLRTHFAVWLLRLAPSTSRVEPAGEVVADAVGLIGAAGAASVAAGLRFGSVWQFAAAATGGRLLCNTSSPFPTP